MREKFDEQLKLLKQKLTEMSSLCQSAISGASEALALNDKNISKKIMNMDAQIDSMEREIERLCITLFMRQQPVARDLRHITSALKMITDLERIGDQASDICEIVLSFKDGCKIELPEHIERMAGTAMKMVNMSLEAYVEKDEKKADECIKCDDIVDELFSKVKEDISKMISEKTTCVDMALSYLMIAKYFERIVDHATNIAEWAEFSVTGKHRKVDKVEFYNI